MTDVVDINLSSALQLAIRTLREGSLVAFPTDTVYGLGALISAPGGIEQLYVVKGREAGKAIPVLVGDPGELSLVAAEIDQRIQKLVSRFWPGPLTLVVPRRPELPESLSPGPTVGVRMPDYPAALALLKQTGPLAVTSANLSEQPPADTAQAVLAQLGGRIPLILDGGRTPGGRASTVVDTTGPELVIFRSGPISLEALLAALAE